MSDSSRKAIIDKVRKLLAMAMGTNNTHEAMSFADRAQTMLAEHNLSTTDLEEGTPEYVVADAPAAVDWQQRVNLAVAKLYFCRYFIAEWRDGSGKQRQLHSFVGEEHNVKVSQMMADYIIKAIERMAKPGIDERIGETARLYAKSFNHQASVGVAVRIKNRILASMANGIVEEGTTLPALRSLYDKSQEELEAFLGQQFGKAAAAGVPQLDRHDPHGLEDGQQAGDSIGLEPQVGGTTTRGLLQ